MSLSSSNKPASEGPALPAATSYVRAGLSAIPIRCDADPRELSRGIFTDGDALLDLPTPAEVRHRKRGQRLAKLVLSFAEWLAPALISILREHLRNEIREVLADDLPGAVKYLTHHHGRGV